VAQPGVGSRVITFLAPLMQVTQSEVAQTILDSGEHQLMIVKENYNTILLNCKRIR